MLKNKTSNFKIITALLTAALAAFVIFSFATGIRLINYRVQQAIYMIMVLFGFYWLVALIKRRFSKFKALKVICAIFLSIFLSIFLLLNILVILVRGERPEKFASPSGKNEVVVIASTGILGDVYNNAYPVRCKWFYNYHKPGVSDSWIGSGSWNNFDIDWTDPDRAVIRLGDDEEDSYAEIIVIF